MSYTRTAKWLHWLVAVLIVANLGLGLTMVGMPGITPTKLRYGIGKVLAIPLPGRNRYTAAVRFERRPLNRPRMVFISSSVQPAA